MRLGREQRRLIQIIAGGAVYFAALLIKADEPAVKPALFLAAFLIAGGTVLWSAARNIFRGEIFDENFLMAVASSGAFAIGEYSEGVAVMLFYQIGELLQNRAVNKSRKSIRALMDIRPDFANIKRGDAVERVSPDDVGVGDLIVIKPGERVPLDAVVTEGSSTLDTSALTGESTPREIAPGDTILSGSINSGGLLTARTTKLFGDSTASRILELVESAQSKKSSSENFITKFARYYTPAVVGFAALLAAVPPLVIDGALFSDWLYRALVFLVISCPCALVISVPLSFFGGIGGASRSGILIKGGNYLEALAKTETVAFDKTGTLTKGVFGVQKLAPSGVSENELLEMAAYAESYSNHPISLSLRRAYGSEPDGSRVSDAEELPGCGVTAVLDGRRIAAGNAKLMEKLGIKYAETASEPGTVVHVAADGVYAGYIVIADELKEDAAIAVSHLRGAGVKNFVLLTGDSKQIGERAASRLGIDRAYSELLPADKVGLVEALLKEKSPRGKLVFVGDGINDAPVLARADIGVAMGGLGSDAAIEAADAVIMNDEPSKLADAILIARKTLRIASQNIVLALSVKGVILLIGVFGMASMWAAVFADVGVAVLAILNSLRTLNVRR